ncbi:MAG: septum formation protein Maf [Bdellovibrionaceae bacterium]|nr:septum formation protein Maf [Bdellovibrionales bacterium]MCB9254655.1 septum formation protein Maf [Pseudobdellovibrionaceae bacterium]
MIDDSEKSNKSNNLKQPPLLLASGSPRRHSLLKSLGFLFHVEVSGAEEKETGLAPNDLALANAELKAKEVLERSVRANNAWVIGADTVVCLDGELLGKPTSREEVQTHLKKLSGKTHQVITGMALLSRGKAPLLEATTTSVRFRKLSAEEIAAYSKTAEPMDKAGSYAIQGLGALFVESVEGSYTNVVGFPVETFLRLLQRATGEHPFSWFELP